MRRTPIPTVTPGQPLTTDQVDLLSQVWDAHAHEWIKWVRAPGRQDSYWRFHRERFLPLVPDPGQLTVDIGCGEGRVGRDLKKLGHTVLGVDSSYTMCRASEKHPERSPAVVGDAARLPLAEASADCAIAFMSLQDIDDMPGTIKEIARVLKDDRPLVLAIVHPMYSGGGFSEADSSSDSSFVVKRSYFQVERLISTDVHGSLKVTLFREHRPLQAYTQALAKAGFIIDTLYELTDEDEDRHRSSIPMFMDIVATRRSRERKAKPIFRTERHLSPAGPPRRPRPERRWPRQLFGLLSRIQTIRAGPSPNLFSNSRLWSFLRL